MNPIHLSRDGGRGLRQTATYLLLCGLATTANAVPVIREARLTIDRYVSGTGGGLTRDVRAGFAAKRRRLATKHLYDEAGSKHFVAITEHPDYLVTRHERAVLEQASAGIMDRLRPSMLIELGSGAADKPPLLDAYVAQSARGQARYVPLEICEPMLVASSRRLLDVYDDLQINGIAGDFERHLAHAPAGASRAVAFLGTTFGNFSAQGAHRFLRRLADQMQVGTI